jgi:hypothetical protein
VELLWVLLYPVRNLHSRFTAFRNEKLVDLSYNSQYPNLQRLLNDKFDLQRRIKVYDSRSIKPVIVYPQEHVHSYDDPVVTPIVVRNSSAYFFNGFTVELPDEFQSDINAVNQINRIVNIHKFTGTKYQIIYS